LDVFAPALDSEGVHSPPIDDWCARILILLDTTPDPSNLVLHIKQFPPIAYPYYVKLQEKIAKKIPDEHLRPNICLDIKGAKATSIHPRIRLIGGAGPLSDANILAGWISAHSLDPDHSHAVLFSFPPPRFRYAHSRTIHHAARYATILSAYTDRYPTKCNFLLSNTAHANLTMVESMMSSNTGPIINMIDKVAESISEQLHSLPNPRIHILGTTSAASAKLYPNALKDQKNITLTTPSLSSQETLQEIIDGVKQGRAQQVGEAFVKYLLNEIEKENTSYILLGCTELPLLLSTVDPQSKTKERFSDKLARALRQNNIPNIILIDSRAKFIECIEEEHYTAYTKHKKESNEGLINLAIFSVAATPVMLAAGLGVMLASIVLGGMVQGVSKERSLENAKMLIKAVTHEAWPYTAILSGIGIFTGVVFYLAARWNNAKLNQTENVCLVSPVRYSGEESSFKNLLTNAQ